MTTQHSIDPLPERHRIPLADKVSASSASRILVEGAKCTKMSLHAVVNIGKIGEIFAAADLHQAPRARFFQHRRHKIGVAQAKD